MGGGAQRPVWCSNELKKKGARSARARTRGQNPLVYYNMLDCGWCGFWEVPNPPVATVLVPSVVYLLKKM
jgi:hypothetical protein